MSLHAIQLLVPEDIERWRRAASTHNGRRTVTARRQGVTFVINYDGKWWTVVKIHGGKEVAQFQSTRVPARVARLVRQAR